MFLTFLTSRFGIAAIVAAGSAALILAMYLSNGVKVNSLTSKINDAVAAKTLAEGQLEQAVVDRDTAVKASQETSRTIELLKKEREQGELALASLNKQLSRDRQTLAKLQQSIAAQSSDPKNREPLSPVLVDTLSKIAADRRSPK